MSTSYITYTWIALGFACFLFVLSSASVERSKGRVLRNHLAFLFTIPCLSLLPEYIQDHIFTPIGIALVATIYPVNESLKAICSLGFVADDTWLQYWVAQVILFYSTLAWTYCKPHDMGVLYKAQFFYTLWLVLPFTDGSALILDSITRFCCRPILSWVPWALNGGWGIVAHILINSIHLFATWFICSELDAELMPFAVIIISTIYPLFASLVSLATTDKSDTTFWLIYYCFFGSFYLLLTIMEAYSFFVDKQTLYCFGLCFMMYLMLPLTRGAEQVFRSIIIPLAGLDELMIIHDSHKLKVVAMKRLSQARQKQVLRMIATSFFEAHGVCEEAEWLRSGDAYDEKLSFKQGYNSIPHRFSEI